MLHHLDWSPVDLETLDPHSIPTTSYKPRGERRKYDSSYTHWTVGAAEHQGSAPAEPSGLVRRATASGFYRIAWRRMAANTGERTLIPALIPPGAAHVNPVTAAGLPSGQASDLVLAGAFLGALLNDFSVRSSAKTVILPGTVSRMPFVDAPALRHRIILRALRLNCLSHAYAELWRNAWDDRFSTDHWTGGIEYDGRRPLAADISPDWDEASPLRVAVDRRQALLEIDVLVALALGIAADELCTIYRTQFPVLYGYDSERDYYDANGRLVPTRVVAAWRRVGPSMSPDDLRAQHTGSSRVYEYQLPFARLDRERDFRRAFDTLSRRI